MSWLERNGYDEAAVKPSKDGRDHGLKLARTRVTSQISGHDRHRESCERNMSTTLDTRELHLVSLDYGGETREVGAIDVNIDQDLVARSRKRGYPRYGRRRERGLCGIVERRFFQRRVDPGLRRQNGRLRRSANEAFGMSLLSFEKDLAPSGGELFGSTIVPSAGDKADSRVPVVEIVVVEETAAE